MDIKQILCETVQNLTKDSPVAKSYEAHQTLLHNTYHFPDDYQRMAYDIVTLTGWHTSTQSMQEFFFAPLSADSFYAWRIPFAHGTCCKAHTHDHIELSYVVDGTLKILVDGKDIVLSKGELLLINAGISHGEYLYAEECTFICLDIDDSFLEQYLNMQDNNDYTFSLKQLINEKRVTYRYIRFSPICDAKATLAAFQTILLELTGNLPGKKRIVIGYVERIIDLLTKEFHMQVSAQDAKDLHRALIQDIQRFIHQHYADISVTKISNTFHYSADYLNRIFKQSNNTTLSSYIQATRLAEALKLIETTNEPIDLIAEKIGYHNHGFFYKKFKEKYHVLPGDIRKK